MDIHPPHGGIHSWKDFGLQLVTITAGILIALSLEGVRESFHNRALVLEARQNIRRELADNKKEVDGEIAGMPESKSRLENALQVVVDLQTRKKTDRRTMQIGFSLAELSEASWQTAERTGALAHMDYGEVQKYARVYAKQELYAAQQRRLMDQVTVAIGVGSYMDEPSQAPPADLERFRQQIVDIQSGLFVLEQLARATSDSYRQALE